MAASQMKFTLYTSAIALSLTCLGAADVPVSDPDLPQPLDYAFADSLVAQSPFTRLVNVEETIQFTGMAYIDGRPVATILNTQTKERFIVTQEPNAQGWQLMTAAVGTQPGQSQIEMKICPEVITMHYQGALPTMGANSSDGSKKLLAKSGKKDSGGKLHTSDLLGKDGKSLYSSLSSAGRDKFKDLMKSQMTKHPELSSAQNAEYAQKIFAKIKASDSSSDGFSSKSSKSSKPPKKKQGA